MQNNLIETDRCNITRRRTGDGLYLFFWFIFVYVLICGFRNIWFFRFRIRFLFILDFASLFPSRKEKNIFCYRGIKIIFSRKRIVCVPACEGITISCGICWWSNTPTRKGSELAKGFIPITVSKFATRLSGPDVVLGGTLPDCALAYIPAVQQDCGCITGQLTVPVF